MKTKKIQNYAFAVAVTLLTTTPSLYAQISQNEDGKRLEKKEMKTHDYIPEIHGTIRGKYEYQPEIDASRFQVRNARFSLTGNIHPIVAYKAEIDLSDQGSIKMLDAYTRIFPIKDLSITIGQMRVPFTIDAHRAPHLRYFANRSFIAKQVGNIRDVGVAFGYNFKDMFPLKLEAGVFNGSGITTQKEWQKELNYNVKATLLPFSGVNLTLSVQSIKPENVRINLYDIGTFYEIAGWHIEGEYLYKQYGHDAFKPVHAVNSFINYDLPLRKVFSKISFLARYDMMTDHSTGIANKETNRLETDHYKRHRLTGGITLSIGKKAFVADIRLNYEKYFYRQGAIPSESERDKLVVEVMTRF